MERSGSSDNVGGGGGGGRSRMLGIEGFMAAAIIALRASASGAPPGDLPGVPATADVAAPGGGAPTLMPGGRPFPPPDPLPEPPPLPVPVPLPVLVTLGVPGASGLPPGDA